MNRNLFDDDNFLFSGQLQTQPNAETSKQCSDESSVDLDRVLHNQEAILNNLKKENQYSAKNAVEKRIEDSLVLPGHINKDNKCTTYFSLSSCCAAQPRTNAGLSLYAVRKPRAGPVDS